jgi:hypothetical protein
MPVSNAANATDKYRAKVYELLSLAERAGERLDLLRFARMWMSLTEGIEDLPVPKLPYEIWPDYFRKRQGRRHSVQC